MDCILDFHKFETRKKTMTKKNWSSILFAVALSLCLSGLAFGQEITGSIVGTVRDTAGAVVPGATVTITDPAKDNLVVRTLTTNDDGGFFAPNLAVSTYNVTVEAANFKKSVSTEVKVDVGQRRQADVVLAAGNISETVTVVADAVAVDANSPTASTTINGDQVRELSLNNRNWVQLVTLAPGVSNDLNDSVSVGTSDPQTGAVNIIAISVNGARSSQNTFTVDGADITDRGSNLTIQAYPSVDSIGEFRVLRSLYPAESGRSGGGQVNVVTRSGTDRFRGNLFEFVRNEKFNANSPAINSLTNPSFGRDDNGKAKRAPFRYNNFGWTIGGPVYFLKFGERDPDDSYFGRWSKTFFFFSQEFRRDIRYPTFVTTVPTALQRTGRFTVPICIQASGTTCTATLAGSVAMPGQLTNINPVAQQYVNFIYNNLPLPNTGTSNGLSAPSRNEAKFEQEVIKIDHSFNDAFSINYRYQRDKIPTLDANSLFSSGTGLPDVSTTSTDSPGRTHTVQGVYTASSNLIFEGRYTFGYGAILSENVGLLALSRSPIAIPLPYANERDRVSSITGNGFTALGGFGPYDNFSWKGNISGAVTWIVGNHTTKYGVVYSKYRKNENALAGVNEGQFSAFSVPGATSTNVIATGGNLTQQQWANFLMGTNATLTQASFDYTADLRQKTFEAYAQDEWKVRRNLTLYAGVRYSFFGAPWDKNGRLTNFIPELWNPAAAPLVEGDGDRVPAAGKNYCNGMIINTNGSATFPNCTPTPSPWGKFVVKAPKNDFAPRVGLAWDPFGDGRTAVRTGYGIYHEQVLNGFYLTTIGTNPPFQQNCVVTGVRLDNPTPGGCAIQSANLVSSLRNIVQAEWETPYMQHWSLDFQRQLTSKTLVTAGYFGSKGTNLIGGFEMNLLKPGEALTRLCAPIGSTTTPTVACQQPNQAFFSTAEERILDQIRPFRGYRSLTAIQPRYNSNYHSLQVSGQQRFTGASQVNLAYTWSKNLTDNPNDRSAAPQNSYDIGLEKSRAALDRRHIFTVNYIYELPFFSKQKGFVGKILGGWQASGIVTFQTGLGFTPTVSGFDPAGLGLIPPPLTVARANVLCDPNDGAPHTVQQWFNTACFQVVPINNASPNPPNVGNASRGLIEGPGTKRVDFTMTKNLRFGERYRVQLRAEAFNVFNWTNPRAINTTVWSATTQPAPGGNGASLFGRVTTFRDPRVMQFGAKFYF
jgi:hypothetical protein